MYATYSELKACERIGYDYAIRENVRGSRIAVMAPHGGKIEPGASELAEAIAGLEYDFYAFEGGKEYGNAGLHIKSTLFDEPRALAMARNAETVLTLHGCRAKGEIVFIGGLFTQMRDCIRAHLERNGFQTAEHPFCPGIEPGNLCNRGRGARGVQLELTGPLRRKLSGDKPPGNGSGPANLFRLFVQSVREGIRECVGT
ncbi:MAG: poly-gamma-glutamate hydrolase family protein [Syntrophobacteraceae bacterium]